MIDRKEKKILLLLTGIFIIVAFSFLYFDIAKKEEKKDSPYYQVESEYIYQKELIDLPPLVVLGKDNFHDWQAKTKNVFKKIYNEVPLESPKRLIWKELKLKKRTIFEYYGEWEADSPLVNSKIGGILAVPETIESNRPIVVFVHGHGMVSPEKRDELFSDEESVVSKLLERGYVVWAPDNVYHEQLMELSTKHDFSVMWAKNANLMWDLVKDKLPQNFNPRGKVICGVAAGGLTGLTMAIVDDDVIGLVTSGAFFSLELTRRDYRIKGHPFCHDFRQFASYLPLYALVLGKPLEIQIGEKDGLWVGQALPPSDYFSGTRRGTLTEEILGGISLLKELDMQKQNKFYFVLHSKGHTDLDVQAVLNFVDEL